MSDWRAQGKQVLQDGRHFADAADEVGALMIVNALRALDEAPQHRGGTVAPPERLPLVGEVSCETVVDPIALVRAYQRQAADGFPYESRMTGASLCRPRREEDEYVCSKGCGVRWDVREPAPRCGRVV